MPYIKFLDTSLERLPAKYLFKGRLNRGVKWAFPKPEEHDPEAHFPEGRQFFWYEFKSAAREFKVMYQPMFCGESGPRTIFTIEACQSYMIEPFSHYPEEAEALLSYLTVPSPGARLLSQCSPWLRAVYLASSCREVPADPAGARVLRGPRPRALPLQPAAPAANPLSSCSLQVYPTSPEGYFSSFLVVVSISSAQSSQVNNQPRPLELVARRWFTTP